MALSEKQKRAAVLDAVALIEQEVGCGILHKDTEPNHPPPFWVGEKRICWRDGTLQKLCVFDGTGWELIDRKYYLR